ncbi:MAG: hypothetical protein P8P48_06095 [Saprospiraceae bacterium]|nr:hypothetical protein [Saprospiraceae bacterium]
MGKNLFDQIAKKSEELKVSPNPDSWKKIESRLHSDNNSSTTKVRILFRQFGIAAAVTLLAVNAYALISFLGKNSDQNNSESIVFMEIPEVPNSEPKIFPISNFEQVSISEGDRNDLLINSNRSVNHNSKKSTSFSKLAGIWTNDQDIELSIFNAEEGALFFAIEDTDKNKLILKAKQMGNEVVITNKKGAAFIGQINKLAYSKEGLLLQADSKKLEIKQIDEYTIQISVTSNQTNTTNYFLNRAL